MMPCKCGKKCPYLACWQTYEYCTYPYSIWDLNALEEEYPDIYEEIKEAEIVCIEDMSACPIEGHPMFDDMAEEEEE